MSYSKKYRTYAQISTDNIIHNGTVIKEKFPGKKILAVLKADAYGHGIENVLSAYEGFSDYYAVATVEEGLKIREKSDKPVLVFAPVPEEQILVAAKSNLTLTVGSADYADTLAVILTEAGTTCNCHLKIDTGLNRSGIRWRGEDVSLREIEHIYSYSCLKFTGTYTHFACGEGQLPWELDFTKMQYDRFLQICNKMKEKDLPLGLCHCCSTGGALIHPEYQLDMVRLGMMPLGMSYSDKSVSELNLKPALTWISHIAQIKEILRDEPVSYGCTFRASKDMRVAMVTCGYADGYRRVYSNKSCVLVGGKKVPVIGRIAMDCLMIDITDVDGADIGAEVILLGSDGINTISAQELSAYGESVSGEVTCAISKRVPRILAIK